MTDLVSAYMQLSSFLDDYGRHGLSHQLLDLMSLLGFLPQEAAAPKPGFSATDFILFDDRGDALNMGHTRRVEIDEFKLDHWVNGEVVASREWVGQRAAA